MEHTFIHTYTETRSGPFFPHICPTRRYNSLQHTATHCTTQCSTLQHTAGQCNTLQHSATPCATRCAIHCNTLQHKITVYHIIRHCTVSTRGPPLENHPQSWYLTVALYSSLICIPTKFSDTRTPNPWVVNISNVHFTTVLYTSTLHTLTHIHTTLNGEYF